jgi:hypothetical protein
VRLKKNKKNKTTEKKTKDYEKTFTLLALVVTMTMAQSVAISDDGSVADGSAILEVKSTTKGFLPPMHEQGSATDCDLAAAMYFTMEVSGLLRNWNYFQNSNCNYR